ncbi:hypothetical protein Esi_0017_0181 [Ectocarpus siliculosus]|uniref:Uncharacterized protein n=1 Tax=Ectocarpus siliculosus TaxID=2880 RepID=D7FMQ0_ECTSI|nr:hypothetical protein Esi_0017_0181 [Ectocarpus siliculosus]|eukprot:CBJ25947.1 hypothetical protein Esi_0017_0181 [Ectocarpus siliculosus]
MCPLDILASALQDDGNTGMPQWNTISYMCPLAMQSHTNFVNGVGDGKHNGFLTDMYAFGKTLAEVYGGSVHHLQGRQGNRSQNPDLEELLDHVTTAKLTARWDIDEVFESDFMKAYASEHPHANDPIITPVASDSGGATAGVVGCTSTSTDADEAETDIWRDSYADAPIPPSATIGVGRASTSGAEGGRGVPMPKFTAYPGPGGWGPAQPSRAAQLAVKAAAKAAKSNVMVPVNVPASVPPNETIKGAEGSAKSSSATSGHSGMWSTSTGMGVGTSTSGTGMTGSEPADSTQTGQTRPSPSLPRRVPGAVDSGACIMTGSSRAGDSGEDVLGLDPDLH